jgi:Mn2+/Fe2+ NRAMP family transporter
VNGVIAVPMMVVMMCIGQSRRLMGKLTIGRPLQVMGWAATGVMGLAVLFMLVTSF